MEAKIPENINIEEMKLLMSQSKIQFVSSKKDYLVSVYDNDSDYEHGATFHRLNNCTVDYLNGFLLAMKEIYGEEMVEYNIVE